ncbi:MAG TPA: hypothetical protein VD838_01995, partial [Anaeromyxobacteraceae bacterium]|nr:hypothetical protein [Anaeromyxobacteraceae bacterium]
MASNDDITAAINSGESLAITPAQMVALLDRLIAEAVVDHKLTISYTVQGRSRTIGITDAQRL